RKHSLDVRRKSPASDASNTRADHLNTHHQRVSEDHRPEHVETELSSGLGIGRDPARIIVRRTGYKTRPELLHSRMCREVLDQLYHVLSPGFGTTQAENGACPAQAGTPRRGNTAVRTLNLGGSFAEALAFCRQPRQPVSAG